MFSGKLILGTHLAAAIIAFILVLLIPDQFKMLGNFKIVYIPAFFIAFWLIVSIASTYRLVWSPIPGSVLVKAAYFQLFAFGAAATFGVPFSLMSTITNQNGITVNIADRDPLIYVSTICLIFAAFFAAIILHGILLHYEKKSKSS